MTFLIRYRDADHNLTKTVVTAEDSIELVKFKNEHDGQYDLVYAVRSNDFEPCP